jgi:predicted transport protein
MPLYRKVGGGFKKLKHAQLDREKTLQQIVEANLLEMLDMHFLETEYPTTFGGRIDTLAVDSSGAPVIIEYKLSSNENVINQGLSYLKWLMAQKVEFFERLVHKKLVPEVAKNIKIDWRNPRVVCIAEAYNKFDLDTAEVVPLRIELLLYRHYEGDIFFLEPVTIAGKEPASLPKGNGNKWGRKGGTPPEPPSLDALFAKTTPQTRALFFEMRGKIFELDETIVEKVTVLYVAYRMTKSFVEVWVQKNRIKLLLRPVEYDDPKGMVQKIPDGYNWTLNKSFFLERPEDLEYAMELIGHSYKDVT